MPFLVFYTLKEPRGDVISDEGEVWGPYKLFETAQEAIRDAVEVDGANVEQGDDYADVTYEDGTLEEYSIMEQKDDFCKSRACEKCRKCAEYWR